MMRKWSEVRRRRSPEAEQRVQACVAAEVSRLPLTEVRRARQLTQARMAELLEIDQGAVSKIEHRADMYLSTLRSYVEALGGELDLIVRFPDGEMVLNHLGEAQKAAATSPNAVKQVAVEQVSAGRESVSI